MASAISVAAVSLLIERARWRTGAPSYQISRAAAGMAGVAAAPRVLAMRLSWSAWGSSGASPISWSSGASSTLGEFFAV